ncbi:MAG: hypothetical protein HXY49_04930 [Ignavibacteriaceae bacterium]|nr:hypothetical protein [Ignavibacteriaceae bacterium]
MAYVKTWKLSEMNDERAFQQPFHTEKHKAELPPKLKTEQIIWNQKTQQVDYIYQLKFLPAGGIKIEF